MHDTGKSEESYLLKHLQAGLSVHVHVGLKAINRGLFCFSYESDKGKIQRGSDGRFKIN